MSKTITVYATDHEVDNWRESFAMAGMGHARPAARSQGSSAELAPGEVSFTTKTIFRLHTKFTVKDESESFVIVSNANGVYRARPA